VAEEYGIVARKMHLTEHFLFRDLPFCGVLLDLRDFTVYRVPKSASAALANALYRSDEAARVTDDLATEEEELVGDFLRDLEHRGVVYASEGSPPP
jgi:hypothetical protein